MGREKIVGALLAAAGISLGVYAGVKSSQPTDSSAIAGQYQCFRQEECMKGVAPRKQQKLKVDEFGSFFFEDGAVLKLDKGIFTDTLENSDGKSVSELKSGDGTLTISWIPPFIPYHYMCYEERNTENPVKQELRRGVFIRPCRGQLYPDVLTAGDYRSDKSLRQLDPAKLSNVKTIPVGTLGGVCADLKKSGVTDIFVPFKVDDQGNAPGCGAYGQLLYPSVGYHNQVSSMVKDAQDAGFDPIGSLMQVCLDVYGKTNIKFHAWFPVFKDPYAAQFGGVTGKLKFDEIDGSGISKAMDYIAALFDPSYTSKLFADPANAKVVAYELGVLNEIMQAYPDLAGINLDYIRYPEVETAVDIPLIGTPPECIRDPRIEGIQKLPCQSVPGQNIAKRVIWNVNGSAIDDFVNKVRTKFPNTTLSADVFASSGSRLGVGQYGVPGLVDIIMPMDYSFFGVGDSNDVAHWISLDRQASGNKKLVPCLRGWTSANPKSQGLVTDLTFDIAAAVSEKADGYAIFTYESFLHDTGSDSLSDLKAKLNY